MLPSRPVVLTITCAWLAALCFCIAWFVLTNRSEPEENAAQESSGVQDEPAADGSLDARFKHIISAVEIVGRLGPNADLAETKRTLVEGCSVAMDTELAALYTIDPCMGSIECDSTEGVSEALQQASLRLLDQRLTDRSQTRAWAVADVSTLQTQDTDALQVMTDSGVRTIIACPIRSQASACGALVLSCISPHNYV